MRPSEDETELLVHLSSVSPHHILCHELPPPRNRMWSRVRTPHPATGNREAMMDDPCAEFTTTDTNQNETCQRRSEATVILGWCPTC